jgi:hypothetical protein
MKGLKRGRDDIDQEPADMSEDETEGDDEVSEDMEGSDLDEMHDLVNDDISVDEMDDDTPLQSKRQRVE